MSLIDIAASLGTALGTAAVVFVSGRKAAAKGGAEGAASALNGTAEAVKRIEANLAHHVIDTSARFDSFEKAGAGRDAKIANLSKQVSAVARRIPAATTTTKSAKRRAK